MLNSIISGYLINKLIHEGHPTIEYDHCANKKQRRKVCTVCRDVCPEKIISPSKEVNWDNCINCNLCVVSCPTRAIRSSAVNISKILEAYQSQSDPFVIGCKRQEAEADIKLHCTASLPWESIARAALDKQVHILQQGCEECPDNGCLSVLTSSLKRVEDFLGEEEYRKHVLSSKEIESPGVKQLSRRELFSFFRKKAKNTVGAVLSESDKERLDGLIYRRMLVRKLKILNREENKALYGWYTLTFTDNCWGCGVCEKICPRGAISIKDLENEKYISHSIWKCDGCGACESVCLEKGLSGRHISYVQDPLQPIATEISYIACSTCGQPVKPGTGEKCIRCSVRAK